MLRSTMPRLLIMALLNPPQLKDTSFIADRLQPPTMGNRLAHTYLQDNTQTSSQPYVILCSCACAALNVQDASTGAAASQPQMSPRVGAAPAGRKPEALLSLRRCAVNPPHTRSHKHAHTTALEPQSHAPQAWTHHPTLTMGTSVLGWVLTG